MMVPKRSSPLVPACWTCGSLGWCWLVVLVVIATREEFRGVATAAAFIPPTILPSQQQQRVVTNHSGAHPRDRRTILHSDISATTSSSSSSSSSTTTPSSHFFSRKHLSDFYPAAAAAASGRAVGDRNVQDDAAATSALIFERLCRAANIDQPSKIQTMAWPVLLSSTTATTTTPQQQQAVVIADQTGSGKTLAYLIPLLHRIILSKELRQQRRSIDETKHLVSDSSKTSRSTAAAQPKLLILAPTAELADQIYSVCHKIAQNYNNQAAAAPFRAAVLTSSGRHATDIRSQIRWLQQHHGKRLDVLVSTPGRISTILRTRKAAETVLDLSSQQAIVLDEVDVLLLDETFGPQLQTVGEATRKKMTRNGTERSADGDDDDGPVAQFVFVTATLPDSVVAQVTEQFPPGAVQLLKGPGLHRVAPTVSETLVDVSVPADQNRNPQAGFAIKARALETALRQNRVRRTLVFCNTVQSCRQVENLLRRLDRQGHIYQVQAYHNALTAPVRNENLDWFARLDDKESNQNNVSRILVCTDRAARGVDFGAAAVDHCVLFDFPTDPADYVRRVGRTARAGRQGAVTVLAYGWQLPVARSVMKQQPKRADKNAGLALFNDRVDHGSNNNKEDNSSWNDDPSTTASKEYLGGVQGRRRQSSSSSKRKSKTDKSIDKNSIEGNIASGRLWGQ